MVLAPDAVSRLLAACLAVTEETKDGGRMMIVDPIAAGNSSGGWPVGADGAPPSATGTTSRRKTPRSPAGSLDAGLWAGGRERGGSQAREV